MEMANNNEEQAKNLQEQEAVIEVDVTDEAAQEVVEDDAKVEDVSEETEKSEQENEKENDSVADDVQTEVAEDESVEDTEEKKEESEPDEQQQESTDEGDSKSDDTDDSADKTEADDVADEPSDKEKELMAQIEDMEFDRKENETLRQIDNMVNEGNANLVKHVQELQSALKEAFKHFGIDESKSLEELEKQDPTKAAIAKTLIETANQRYVEKVNDINAKITAMEDEAIFARAEKIIKKYNLSPEQLMAAAQTFANILNEVGVKDLKEDLTAKIKLSVAQAKMDVPDVVEVTQVKEEVKVEEDVQNEEVKEEKQAPAVEEEPPVEEKVEEQKPDLSEFMEGIEGSAAKASDVHADNVLAKLNALPFKERTKFYKENMDLINEAMKNARGNL